MCWRGDTRDGGEDVRRCRHAIAAYFAEVTDAGSDRDLAEHIVGELLGNVTRYAPGPFCAELNWVGDTPHLTVHDSGPCFHLGGPNQAALADWEAEHGRGLALIRAAGGIIHTNRPQGTGCRVTVIMPLKKHPGPIASAPHCPNDHPALKDEQCPRILAEIAHQFEAKQVTP